MKSTTFGLFPYVLAAAYGGGEGSAIQLRVRVRPWVPTHEQMYALDTVSEFRTGDSTRARVRLRRQIPTGQLQRVEQWETAGRRCTVFMISSQSCASPARNDHSELSSSLSSAYAGSSSSLELIFVATYSACRCSATARDVPKTVADIAAPADASAASGSSHSRSTCGTHTEPVRARWAANLRAPFRGLGGRPSASEPALKAMI